MFGDPCAGGVSQGTQAPEQAGFWPNLSHCELAGVFPTHWSDFKVFQTYMALFFSYL